MSTYIVFNHHSLPFDSKELADNSVIEFLKICLKVKNLGLTTILLDKDIDSKWYRIELSTNYYLQDWFNQNKKGNNIDIIRAFMSLATRQPYFSQEDIDKNIDLFEVYYKNNTYQALRACAWFNCPLISFPTKNPWDTNPLVVHINQLDENIQIQTFLYEIKNYYSLQNIEYDKDILIQQKNACIKKASDIITNKKTYFPYLEFCSKVKQQLTLTFPHINLKQIIESLSALNTFCEEWKSGNILAYSDSVLYTYGLNHEVSGESYSVRDNIELKKQREFILPNGDKKYFEKHIKLQTIRIHFYPDNDSKIIYIGYIGKHLPTKKYN